MSQVTALWEPETTPPDDWLLPAILYQDRISTFAPLGDGGNENEHQRLKDSLGDLYEPLNAYVLDLSMPVDDPLVQLFAGMTNGWRQKIERLAVETGDPALAGWLQASRRAQSGRRDREAELRTLQQGIVDAQHELDEAIQRQVDQVSRQMDEVGQRREVAQLAAQRLRDEHAQARRARLEPHVSHLEKLLRRRRRARRSLDGTDLKNMDREIQDVTATLRRTADLAPDLPFPPDLLAARAEVRELNAEHRRIERLVGSPSLSVATAQEKLRDLEERYRQAKQSLVVPMATSAGERTTIEVALQSRWFDSLAFGKIPEPLVELLASEAGLWVAEYNGHQWERALVGPSVILRDVLSVVARYYCASTPGWVPMGHIEAPTAHESTPGELQALAIQALLPAPGEGTTLEDVVKFRLTHEEELEEVRRHLAVQVGDTADIAAALDAINSSLRQPLEEIRRAAALDKRVSWRWVRRSSIGVMGDGVKGTVAGVATGLATAPILGLTLSPPGLSAGFVGALAVSSVLLAGRLVANWSTAEWLGRRAEDGPFEYLYHLSQQHGLDENP